VGIPGALLGTWLHPIGYARLSLRVIMTDQSRERAGTLPPAPPGPRFGKAGDKAVEGGESVAAAAAAAAAVSQSSPLRHRQSFVSAIALFCNYLSVSVSVSLRLPF
jgi:hypothetical protein